MNIQSISSLCNVSSTLPRTKHRDCALYRCVLCYTFAFLVVYLSFLSSLIFYSCDRSRRMHYKFVFHDEELQFRTSQRCAIARYFCMKFLFYRRYTVQFYAVFVRTAKVIVVAWNVVTVKTIK